MLLCAVSFAQGVVTLSAVAGEDGRARGIRVVRSLAPGMEENAIAAVTNWRFAPGTRVECNFRMPADPAGWSLECVPLIALPGAALASILRAASARPSVPENVPRPAAGAPATTSTSSLQPDDEVLAMIREWRGQTTAGAWPRTTESGGIQPARNPRF
jgi:hypothetical protein